MKMQKKKLVAAMALAAAIASPAAFATNGILQAGNGMIAHGLGGAGLANAAEASSGMDNPALISHTGNAINIAWSMFSPLREMDASGIAPIFQKVVSDSNEYAIPQASFTVKASDKVSWGVMAYALGGMNTDYPKGPTLGTSPETVNLQGLVVSPMMSFAVNPDVSVGVAALIAKATFRARNLFGSGFSMEDSATGFGAKLGVNWNVTKGVSLGATYQSKVDMDEMADLKAFFGAFGFTGDAQLTVPDQYGIGAKFAVSPSVDIVADVFMYKWSGIDVFEFFGWEDQTVVKIGAEFRPTNNWAVRVGYNHGKSPIKGGNTAANGTLDAAFANYPFPAISEQHYTLGAGYKLSKDVRIDGYFLYSPENTEEASAGLAPVAGFKVSMRQSAMGLGLNVNF